MSLFVVHSCDLSEALLTCCVPNEHADGLCIGDHVSFGVLLTYLDRLNFEVPRYCRSIVVLLEEVFDVSLDE